MQKPSISLCMIVRDEEPCLQETIESCRDDVDCVVIVDTGSTDNTVALARQLGATVYHFDWNDDFSAARNFALAQCATDWVFMIDADESLTHECRGMVRAAIERASEDCGEILPLLIMRDGEHSIQHYCQKIFRRGWGTWKYPSHNVYVLHRGVAVHAPHIKLHHDRLRRGEERHLRRCQQRDTMNEKNFRRMVEENPNDLRAIWYLALTLADAGKLEESIPWWQQYIEKSTWSEEIYEARYALADVLIRLGRHTEAVDHLILAYKDEPRRAEAAIALGDMYVNGGAYRRAEFWYRVATMIDDPVVNGCRLFMQPHCYGLHPWLRLARLYHLQGDLTQRDMAIQAARCCARSDDDQRTVDEYTQQLYRQNINTREYWDAIYQKGRDIGEAHRNLLRRVAELAGPGNGEMALDFGAGTGELVDLLRQEGWDAWGVDFSAVAATQHPYIAFGDACTFKAPELCQVVTAVSILEHVNDPQMLVCNMVENTAPGGKVIISVPVKGRIQCAEHIHEFTQDDIKRLLEKTGVDKVSTETYHTWEIVTGEKRNG